MSTLAWVKGPVEVAGKRRCPICGRAGDRGPEKEIRG
jgi:hypothetical protein